MVVGPAQPRSVEQPAEGGVKGTRGEGHRKAEMRQLLLGCEEKMRKGIRKRQKYTL